MKSIMMRCLYHTCFPLQGTWKSACQYIIKYDIIDSWQLSSSLLYWSNTCLQHHNLTTSFLSFLNKSRVSLMSLVIASMRHSKSCANYKLWEPLVMRSVAFSSAISPGVAQGVTVFSGTPSCMLPSWTISPLKGKSISNALKWPPQEWANTYISISTTNQGCNQRFSNTQVRYCLLYCILYT